jgi:hypothetical protein
MNVWLAIAAALGLIPVARLFMANGCGTSGGTTTPPRTHGTSNLRIYVEVNNRNPRGGPDGDARINGGNVRITSPTGRSESFAFGPGGLIDHAFPATAADFTGVGNSFNWRALAVVGFTATQPVPTPPGGQTASGTWMGDWDANADRTIRFVLELEDMVPMGTVGGPPVEARLAWVVRPH